MKYFDLLREKYIAYKEVILYLIFGGLTTVINIVTYYVFTHIFNQNYMVSNVIAWVIAVFFAYITNKIFVFESSSNELKVLFKEIVAFVSCRIFSLLIDLLIMYTFIQILDINDLITKILSNIVVVVMNYIFSKFFIFKKN